MRFSVNFVAALALAATFAVATTVSANAECKRYGFTVNDYGKDGPTKDAKDLLDKLISSKMTEKGVSDFHTGKKSVSCELFLNFIVFDEHTCTAEATVCWGGTPLPGSEQAATGGVEPASKTASDDAATDAKPAEKKTTKEAAVHLNAAPPVHKVTAQAFPDPKSVVAHKAKKAVEKKEASARPADAGTSADSTSTDSAVKPVETGSLSETATKPAKHKAQKSADGSGAVAPIKQKSDDAGYPTPLPPQDGATDGSAQ
jgi:hypothetical protein